MWYYFLLFFFNFFYSSFYTFDDFKNHQDHLNRSQLLLGDDCQQLKKSYANKIFKEALGFPNRIAIFPLNTASKKTVELAYTHKACCNPKINPSIYADKSVYRLLDYLVLLHKFPQHSLITENKLKFLIKKKYVDIDDQNYDRIPLVSYIFTVPTFNLLYSLGCDINAVDKKGRNFPIKIHENIEPYSGNESEDELKLKRDYYNHIQYMIDYFYRKKGFLFRKDCCGNTVLNYILWNGFQFLTESRIDLLIKRFKASGEDEQIFLLSLVRHSSYYFNDFNKEYSFLSEYQEKLKVLKEKNDFLIDLEDISILKKPIKDDIAKSIRVLNKQFAIQSTKRSKRLHILEQYIAYLQTIFRCLLKNGIDMIGQSVSAHALEYVLNKNNGAIDENFFYEAKTIDALLYHFIIFIGSKYDKTIENNFIFSWIVCRKLLKYKESNKYKKRIRE